jgi:hypothetical protein
LAWLGLAWLGLAWLGLWCAASFPFYLTWISYTSLFAFEFAAMSINEFQGNVYNCPYAPGNPVCSLYDGDRILESLNVITLDFDMNLVYLAILAAIFRVASLIILLAFKRKPE